ncbi:MAG: hypothetical protein IPL35_01640 [Sphingobacteriales bacterium]|nr:hypothetical protein [Sphingobacteriales bacterium]
MLWKIYPSKSPITLEKERQQVQWLKETSQTYIAIWELSWKIYMIKMYCIDAQRYALLD